MLEALGAAPSIRQLSDTRLYVNDPGRHRLLLLDSALRTLSVVADTLLGTLVQYGSRAAQIIAFLGDSTLFVEPTSQSILVLDSRGRVGHVAAAPKASDFAAVASGRAGADLLGRLVYRVVPGAVRLPSADGTGSVTHGPDSAAIVRADFDSRAVDTIAKLKVPVPQVLYAMVGASGAMTHKSVVNPVSWVDDWAMCPDGTIAIVRGQDYHIDWVSVDGKVTSTPRLPFDWRRITGDEKQRLADSARQIAQAQVDSARARASRVSRSSGGVGLMGSRSALDGTSTSTPMDAEIASAPLSEMPDYFPPIRAGAVRADLEGNVWILPFTSRLAGASGVVYDVVNQRGESFERVQLPAGRSIVGFGVRGVLYLAWRDNALAWHVEMTRVVR
jgi:hypothetical protein